MTPEQYWNGDPALTRYYREADKLRRKRKNEELWWQGLYIYKAILCNVPVLRAFSKAEKPDEYPEKPFPIDEQEVRQQKEDAEKKQMAENINYMETFMRNFKPKPKGSEKK